MDFRKSYVVVAIVAWLSALPLFGQTSAGVLNRVLSAVEAEETQSGKAAGSGDATGNVLDLLLPADVDGTITSLLATYEAAPEQYEGNIVGGALNGIAAFGILDYIYGAYGGDGRYYDSGEWGAGSAAGNGGSIYKGPMPEYNPSDFYRPVWGRITSNFGYRPSFGRMHKGVDIALNTGDTVRAALPGIVMRVSYDPGGYGNFVVLTHSNGVETRYAHLQEAIAFPGQRVEAGQPIALGGNTGNSTGPHLHFEVRHMGTPVDPLATFDFSGRSVGIASRADSGQGSRRMATGLNGAKTSLKSKTTYVVRDGDTVKKVASRAGISVFRLCQLNFITEDTPLQPGRMLKLR